MGLSNFALESMGFEKFDESHPIEAKFQSLNVYEIRGINSKCDAVENPNEVHYSAGEISVSIGDSLNSICTILVDDDFADDEEEWCTEKKVKPPFLMIHTSLQEYDSCKSGYRKKKSGELVTHDCFTLTKERLRQLEKDKAFPFVSAFSASLSTPDRMVSFIPIDRIVFGTTRDNLTVHDFRFEGKADLYVSKNFNIDDVKTAMSFASNSLGSIHSKVGYFYDLAIRENDSLKKFLYYFLAIEVHTHQVFKNLDYSKSFSALNRLPTRITDSATSLLTSYQKDAKSLAQRFIWCAMLTWESVTDDDVKQFKLLKKYRDQIYHGEDIDLKTLPLQEAQKLILKIMKDHVDR